VGALDGQPGRLTEMDAIVAYLQILGRMVDFTDIRTEDLIQ
jgi:cytochrome c oxidase cbb3-type subunit 2